jgi:predicted outer membrane protein
MMVKDHSAANAQLQGIAASQDVKCSMSASVMQLTKRKELQMLSRDCFDKAYIKDQIKVGNSVRKRSAGQGLCLVHVADGAGACCGCAPRT